MKPFFYVAAIAAVALAGCQRSREDVLVGTWQSQQQGMAGASLELKKDKTFSIGQGTGQATGKWSLSDSTLVLETETVAGKPKAEALKEFDQQLKSASPQVKQALEPMKKMLDRMEMKLSEDNKTLTFTTNFGGQSQSSTFTKKEGA